MDVLHVLAEKGVRCVNQPRAIERTIDKSWAGAVLSLAGVPTPPTVVCERHEDAMEAFCRVRTMAAMAVEEGQSRCLGKGTDPGRSKKPKKRPWSLKGSGAGCPEPPAKL